MLLADKATFPRDKPCGGGLTMRAVRLLPFSVDPVVEDRTTRVRFGLDFAHRFERRLDDPLVLMTQRTRLDAFLAEQAAEAGADFRDGVRVADLVAAEHGVEATVNGSKVAANHALLADGANGTSTRAVGLDDGRDYGVALEANVPYGVVSEDEYRGLLCLELANVPGGYGWVFPKGDHVNVGVGGWEREGPRLRTHLARFCREYGIPESSLENVRGHRLPLIHARARVAEGRVALLGDAAGLVDPLSGDGIYEAFLSAKLATEALLAGDLRELRRRASPPALVPALRGLGSEGRPRPLPAAHLRGRPHAVPLERGRLTDRRRRPEPERDARPAPCLDARRRGHRPRRRRSRSRLQDGLGITQLSARSRR